MTTMPATEREINACLLLLLLLQQYKMTQLGEKWSCMFLLCIIAFKLLLHICVYQHLQGDVILGKVFCLSVTYLAAVSSATVPTKLFMILYLTVLLISQFTSPSNNFCLPSCSSCLPKTAFRDFTASEN